MRFRAREGGYVNFYRKPRAPFARAVFAAALNNLVSYRKTQPAHRP